MDSFQAGKNRGELKKEGFTTTITDGHTVGSPEEEEACRPESSARKVSSRAQGPLGEQEGARAGRPDGAMRPAQQLLSLCCYGLAPWGDITGFRFL